MLVTCILDVIALAALQEIIMYPVAIALALCEAGYLASYLDRFKKIYFMPNVLLKHMDLIDHMTVNTST